MPIKKSCCGFTLVELLIVVAIISLLMQLTIPAIEAARESARLTQCRNNLRQIGLGVQLHLDAHEFFPSSGWGWKWTGYPDQGYGEDQPGGWAYDILPYIEQGSLRELGSGLAYGSPELKEEILRANSTPIPMFYCPSRRLPRAYPMVRDMPNTSTGFYRNFPERCVAGDADPCRVARNDYGANSGNLFSGGWSASGPDTFEQAETWKWGMLKDQNGITYQRSQVRIAQVTDGMSNTICLGERYIPVTDQKNGMDAFDDQSMFVGHDGDINRYTGSTDGSPILPMRDTDVIWLAYPGANYGSSHITGCNYAFCDGSVRFITFSADPEIHRLRGGRNDE